MRKNLISKGKLTPRQRQMRFRNTMKKIGWVTYFTICICCFVAALGFAGKSDYESELAIASEPDKYVLPETEPKSFEVETRTEDAVLVRMEGENLVFRTEDGHEWKVTGEIIQTLEFGDIMQTPDDITDDVVLGWEEKGE